MILYDDGCLKILHAYSHVGATSHHSRLIIEINASIKRLFSSLSSFIQKQQQKKNVINAHLTNNNFCLSRKTYRKHKYICIPLH